MPKRKMNKKKLFLGIDTSNYTTSVALCDEDGNVLLNLKKLLPVKEGERGLRQSDALFAHTKNLPIIMEQLGDHLKANPDCEIAAVGYSATPRDIEGSYMPCFLAGKAVAETSAAVLGCPLYSFSHQNGHVMAALYSSHQTRLLFSEEDFAAFHVSGGTTELLLIHPDEKGFIVEQIGGTSDMNAGQAIDRTGVMMGLSFPCGKEMEQICNEAGEIPHAKTKIAVSGLNCNLSGLENLTAKLYRECGDKAKTCAYCFDFIADTLEALTDNLRDKFGNIPVIFAGGVKSNKSIGLQLAKIGNTYFSEPEFSSDNAAGIALLCRRKYLVK